MTENHHCGNLARFEASVMKRLDAVCETDLAHPRPEISIIAPLRGFKGVPKQPTTNLLHKDSCGS